MPISLLVRLPYMSNWMTGETKSLKSGTAMRAAEFLGVSQMWLAEGRGPAARATPTSRPRAARRAR